jgi:hypothetical protein
MVVDLMPVVIVVGGITLAYSAVFLLAWLFGWRPECDD